MNRLLSAIPVLTIMASKNTTPVMGRRPRKSPNLILLQSKLEIPNFDNRSFPVESKIVSVAMQKNRLQYL